MKNILKFIRQSLHNRKCAAVCGDDNRAVNKNGTWKAKTTSLNVTVGWLFYGAPDCFLVLFVAGVEKQDTNLA